MRRVEKELLKKRNYYIDRLQKFGILQDELFNVPSYLKRKNNIYFDVDLHTLGGFYFLNMDFDILDLLGTIELSFYHDNTFGISRESSPIYVNDQSSLIYLIKIFFGTPFDLYIEKIRECDFDRYCITLPELTIQDFSELLNSISLLHECLFQVHEAEKNRTIMIDI